VDEKISLLNIPPFQEIAKEKIIFPLWFEKLGIAFITN